MTPFTLGFPSSKFPDWRKYQLETILDISTCTNRFSLLQAPPGAGKSLTNFSVARLLDLRTLYLVGTKGLQEQALRDFESVGLVDIRGHSNYKCGHYSRDMEPRSLVPGGEGDNSDRNCRFEIENCEYRQALDVARNSQLVISNYALWLTLERVGKPFDLGKFDLLILDEAHKAEEWLSKFCVFSVRQRDFNDIGLEIDLPTNETWKEWVFEVLDDTVKLLKSMNESVDKKRKRRLQGFYRNLKGISTHVKETDWLLESKLDQVTMKPVWSRAYAEEFLFRGVDRVLLSSATITEDTARFLGIGDDEYNLFSVPSTFPPKRRPLIYVPGTGRIDYRARKSEGLLRLIVNRIDQIIETRLDRKGVIHTRSYDWASVILSRSKFKDRMITHKRGDKGGVGKALSEFKRSSPGSILVSPSITEGIDFKGDECRYQVILKVPFVDSRDSVVSARKKSEKRKKGQLDYSLYLTAQDIVQMYGRSTRSKDDWSECFILDEHWNYFRYKGNFPKWMSAAFRECREVPKPLKVR